MLGWIFRGIGMAAAAQHWWDDAVANVATGVQTGAVLAGSWTFFCGVFEVCERFNAFPVKTQDAAKTTGAVRLQGLRDSLFNWAWILALVPFSGGVFEGLFPRDIAMSPSDCALCFALSVVVFDVWFYAFHRTLHEVGWLYRRFHKPHHIYKATFVWMSHAQSPVEVALNGIGTLAGPVLFGANLHFVWAWLAFVQLFGVLDHCGYSFGSVWGVTSPQHHDAHHRLFNVNYGGMFTVFDHMFGTHQVAA